MINKNTGDTISFTDIKNEFGMPPGKNLGAYRISQSVGGLSNLGLDNDDDTGQSHRPPTSIIPQSGTIRFSDFYQKRLNVVVDYYSGGDEEEGKNNLNIKTAYKTYKSGKVTVLGFKSSAPSITSGSKIIIHVNKKLSRERGEQGKYDQENSNITLRTGGAWESGTQLRVDVGAQGRIFGAGGDGGEGGTAFDRKGGRGEQGTSALGMAYSGDVHVHPGGKIIGGGGGGGGGGGAHQKDGGQTRKAGGSGGGGGQGDDKGRGGEGGYKGRDNTRNRKKGKDGESGSRYAGGAGGAAVDNDEEAYGGRGGAGFGASVTMELNDGESGDPGTSNQHSDRPGGAGGRGGSAVRRKSSGISFNVYYAGSALVIGRRSSSSSNQGFN